MSFQTIDKNSVLYLTSDILTGVRHGFSTRRGGVSPAPWDSLNLDDRRGDSHANVQENFRRLCHALDVDVQRVVLSKQVHRDDVRLVTEHDIGKGLWRAQDYDSADALITDVPELPLFVFSADCGVILLHDPVHHAIGAVHAGWRGTVLGIVKKTVEAMRDAFGTDPGDLQAAIGPSIGQCCFETDDDVPAALRQALGHRAEPFMIWNGRKWHIDLKSVNRYWLQDVGVTQIDLCADCTYCLPELYWSHRRTGLARGEQAAVIALPSR
ncbi:MAG: peptidoglycan editing factor PgeF [Clostridiales bacterium]|nr:peptidoglycan editing factor PgeF [Candidatus Cacconaster stercorequi]